MKAEAPQFNTCHPRDRAGVTGTLVSRHRSAVQVSMSAVHYSSDAQSLQNKTDASSHGVPTTVPYQCVHACIMRHTELYQSHAAHCP